MKLLYAEKLARILKNKKRLEQELNIKITNKGDELNIDGKPEDEYIAEQVIDALNFGFPLKTALAIKKDDLMFETINIKEYTRRKDLEKVRARIIGTKGRAFKTLCDLTNCCFELKGNEVGIIGAPECIKNAQDAIISIARGAKHANVYIFLEKHKAMPVFDLGLKPVKKKSQKK